MENKEKECWRKIKNAFINMEGEVFCDPWEGFEEFVTSDKVQNGTFESINYDPFTGRIDFWARQRRILKNITHRFKFSPEGQKELYIGKPNIWYKWLLRSRGYQTEYTTNGEMRVSWDNPREVIKSTKNYKCADDELPTAPTTKEKAIQYNKIINDKLKEEIEQDIDCRNFDSDTNSYSFHRFRSAYHDVPYYDKLVHIAKKCLMQGVQVFSVGDTGFKLIDGDTVRVKEKHNCPPIVQKIRINEKPFLCEIDGKEAIVPIGAVIYDEGADKKVSKYRFIETIDDITIAGDVHENDFTHEVVWGKVHLKGGKPFSL